MSMERPSYARPRGPKSKIKIQNWYCSKPKITVVYAAPSGPTPPPPPPITIDETINSIFRSFESILDPQYVALLRLKQRSKDKKFLKSQVGIKLNQLIEHDVPAYVAAKNANGHGYYARGPVVNTMNKLKKALRDELGTTSVLWRGKMKPDSKDLTLQQRLERWRNGN